MFWGFIFGRLIGFYLLPRNTKFLKRNHQKYIISQSNIIAQIWEIIKSIENLNISNIASDRLLGFIIIF